MALQTLKTLNENALFEVYIICGKVIRVYDFQKKIKIGRGEVRRVS